MHVHDNIFQCFPKLLRHNWVSDVHTIHTFMRCMMAALSPWAAALCRPSRGWLPVTGWERKVSSAIIVAAGLNALIPAGSSNLLQFLNRKVLQCNTIHPVRMSPENTHKLMGFYRGFNTRHFTLVHSLGCIGLKLRSGSGQGHKLHNKVTGLSDVNFYIRNAWQPSALITCTCTFSNMEKIYPCSWFNIIAITCFQFFSL